MWSNLENMPTLIPKLAIILVLISCLCLLSYNDGKAQKGDPAKVLKRLKLPGPVTLLVSLTIIILAIFSFHLSMINSY
jgi:hypothetical protein